MNVRAKFRVTHHEIMDWGPNQGKQVTVHLSPQYDPNLKEDQSYAKSTPSGKLTMVVDNPAALAEFVPGRAFYLDFTAVE
jgi:hypothetical protein